MSSSILVAVERRFAERALKAIFRAEDAKGEIEWVAAGSMSSAFGTIESSLLSDPGRPVAMVYNAKGQGQEEVESDRAAIHRMLHHASYRQIWHVSVAIPDVIAWIMADPAIRPAFDQMVPVPSTREERAEKIGEVAARRPIDREAIARAFPDFRSLVEFIGTHARASEPVA